MEYPFSVLDIYRAGKVGCFVTMSWIWTGMVVLALVAGTAAGRGPEVAAAAVSGAGEAVELTLSMGGLLCLWSGVMEVMGRSGMAAGLARVLRPVLGRLFPSADRETMDSLSANVSANLLGLGSAATPPGIRAARGLGAGGTTANDALCLLVVCNSASIQLIPTTVASVRAAAGSAAPFDILPAVWLASSLSVLAGIGVCKLCARWWRD